MAELTFKSAGVSSREIDLSGPSGVEPVGVPAGIIGTANRGPAFVPVTLATFNDFTAKFGESDGEKYGPLAVNEWLRSARAVTYLRVLGTGVGEKRSATTGEVESAGFVVGEQQPQSTGNFGDNSYAAPYGDLGRTYFLGCYMSESAGSTLLSDAGIQTSALPQPIIRGVLMAASGVLLRLSASIGASGGNDAPVATDPATANASTLKGALTGAVKLSNAAQEFVMLLNGHEGTDSAYPNVVTASFDPASPSYLGKVFNKDPYKLEKAGYMLYTQYDIHPALAAITGSDILATTAGAGAVAHPGFENVAFITTGSNSRNGTASSTVPNYESFQERFAAARTPFIISQKFGGTNNNLFRIHALSDGAAPNTQFKISIENVAASSVDTYEFGLFDLVVRAFGDNDDNKVILEQFRGLSIDPSADRYIARVIGDQHIYFDFDKAIGSQKLVVDGKYPNRSNYIRIEMAADVESGETDPSALPVGFRGHYHLVTSGSAPLTTVTGSEFSADQSDILNRAREVPVPFRKNLSIGTGATTTANTNLYWGVQFENQTSISELNKSLTSNRTIESFTKFFPTFAVGSAINMVEGDNAGVADAATTGILDADRFNFNLFSLENIQAKLDDSSNLDFKNIHSWSYTRDSSTAADSGFRYLDPELDFTNLSLRNLLKFTCYLQGGFDGTNTMNRDEASINNEAVYYDMTFSGRGQDRGPNVKTYKKALEIMGNTSDVDIQLLAVPGIREPVISNACIDMVENRFDALYLMDIEQYPLNSTSTPATSSLQDVGVKNTASVFSLRALDTSFAAAYFPDVVITDPHLGTAVQVPPSVAVLGAFALNDVVAFPWFAPAGFARGALQNAHDVAVKLSRANLDTLYDVDINPITSFPGSNGIVVWGQKTLLAQQSALDRVNVRRLLINLRRQVRRVANSLLFEPNRESTLARFSAQVDPILKRVQEQSGVERYKVQIDTTTTTQADVENNTIRGRIYIQPTRVAEFVSLDFVVTNAGRGI